MSQLLTKLSQYWNKIQGSLFPWIEEELEPLTKKQQQLISILEVVQIERFLPDRFGCEGRPPESRSAIARAFIGKMVYNMDTNTILIERLTADKNFRRICGWETRRQIPSESTFSRAFAEFAASTLPQVVHAFLIEDTLGEEIISHNSRDSTAIEAREKPLLKPAKTEQEQIVEKAGQRKRGRPKKDEIRQVSEPELTCIEKQRTMPLGEILTTLPTACNVGAKKNSKGNVSYWIGYKLHLDTVDGGIPISAILTSASMHDSQAAIPLAMISASRVTTLYDLMDAAYDDPNIIEHSKSLGHVPLIDKNPRRNKELKAELEAEAKARNTLNWKPAEAIRYNERSTAERTNARLKDEFGGRKVRVRGNIKVACHLMFGVLALAADQLLKIVI